jgi:hypothetical protein
MESSLPSRLLKEEQVVAELSRLGIDYLSRISDEVAQQPRPVWMLLADIVRQPSSRVRTALIALLLEHPEVATAIPVAVKKVYAKNRTTLKYFYTAAFLLQKINAKTLMNKQGKNFQWLPNYFEDELKIKSDIDPEQSLLMLCKKQQEVTGSAINWAGTYKNILVHVHF